MAGGIEKLLIANRGEIVVRIARTARRLGIATAAVYSDADAEAPFVAAAGQAVRIGPPPARESYLDIKAILAAAQATGADAVHPGYGFLAENAAFAEACAGHGLIFVGPSARSIAIMGDKAQARRLARSLGIATVPGYDGEDQSAERLAREAEAIGYSVLLKPAAGGGGKGMKIVEQPQALEQSLAMARREAMSAFGDDRIILERYLEAPRHIEVQVFCDRRGHAVHLFERDCSIQRRHQKVIEESPALGLSDAARASMREAALKLARACKYVGAGTLEFLVANQEVFFIEMNTRLQVEHTVTEEITGLDLVEWQLRIAAGEDLPLPQSRITATGHAIEARLCAEDPQAGFLPQSGTIEHFHEPSGLTGLRVDSAAASGASVPVYYDSLIAKIIAHGKDRAEAIRRLAAALKAVEVAGVTTNRGMLLNLVADEDFRKGACNTQFIASHAAALIAEALPGPRSLALAAFAAIRDAEDKSGIANPADPHSPWASRNGWRLLDRGSSEIQLLSGGALQRIGVHYRERGYVLSVQNRDYAVAGEISGDGAMNVRLDGMRLEARAIIRRGTVTLFHDGGEYRFAIRDPYTTSSTQGASAGDLRSPMPGTVVSVSATIGSKVRKGSPLAIIEAMKMEHTIAAPRDGIVARINVKAGDQVAAGTEIAAMEPVP